MIEFKGPTDKLEHGDLDQFFACAHLFRSQQRQLPRKRDVTLIILAPRITAPFRGDVERSEMSLREHEPGIHSLEGGFFACWVLETDVLAGLAEPILTLFSRVFLRETRRIIEEWKQSGHDDVLFYVMQQVEQFQRMGEAFDMQHKESEKMRQTLEELKAAVFAEIPTEEILRRISPEDLLKRISPEQIIQSLDDDERRRLLDLLKQKLENGE